MIAPSYTIKLVSGGHTDYWEFISKIETSFEEVIHVHEFVYVYQNSGYCIQVVHWTISQGSGEQLFSCQMVNSENFKTEGT